MQFGLKEKDIDLINSIFKEYKSIEQFIIYGSRAKGNYKNGSDIDLTFTQLLEIENKLDDLLLPYKIDLSQKRIISNIDLIEHINRIGQIFYTKNT